MDFKQLRIRALVLDCLTIALAIATLYLGTNGVVPEWAMIVMLVLTVALLVAAMVNAHKARKIQNQELRRLTEAARKAAREKEQAENQQ